MFFTWPPAPTRKRSVASSAVLDISYPFKRLEYHTTCSGEYMDEGGLTSINYPLLKNLIGLRCHEKKLSTQRNRLIKKKKVGFVRMGDY